MATVRFRTASSRRGFLQIGFTDRPERPKVWDDAVQGEFSLM
jgi:hypothetical protein